MNPSNAARDWAEARTPEELLADLAEVADAPRREDVARAILGPAGVPEPRFEPSPILLSSNEHEAFHQALRHHEHLEAMRAEEARRVAALNALGLNRHARRALAKKGTR